MKNSEDIEFIRRFFNGNLTQADIERKITHTMSELKRITAVLSLTHVSAEVVYYTSKHPALKDTIVREMSVIIDQLIEQNPNLNTIEFRDLFKAKAKIFGEEFTRRVMSAIDLSKNKPVEFLDINQMTSEEVQLFQKYLSGTIKGVTSESMALEEFCKNRGNAVLTAEEFESCNNLLQAYQEQRMRSQYLIDSINTLTGHSN